MSRSQEEVPSLDEYSEYDDPRKRREIRSMYRDLMNETQKNKEDLVKPQSNGLIQVLNCQEGLFDKVRHTREAVLDSTLLLSVTNLGSEQAKQLQTDFVIFDPEEFADKLIHFMTPNKLQAQLQQSKDIDDDGVSRRRVLDSLDWMKLGKKCAGCFQRAPTVDFMLGPLVIEVPEGRSRRKTTRTDDKPDASQKQAPQELTQVEEHEEATTKEVARIFGILRKLTNDGSKPIGFFEFITNPTSFGQTIENLFHLSFLIKDGKANIQIDDEGQPTICCKNIIFFFPGDNLYLPVKRYQIYFFLLSDFASGTSNPYREQDYQDVILHKQIIMPLSMGDWKEIVDVYDIRESLIPARPGSRKQ